MSGCGFVRFALGLLGIVFVLQLVGCSSSFNSSGHRKVVAAVDGCKFVALEPTSSQYTYGPWSGACENGYLSGPGYLGTTIDCPTCLNDGHWTRFTVMRPGKPMEFYIYFIEGESCDYRWDEVYYRNRGGCYYVQDVVGSIKKHHHLSNDLTREECISIRGCKEVHDAYLNESNSEQQAILNSISAQKAAKQQQTIRNSIKSAEGYAERSKEIDRKIKERNRADKQRWLAEKKAEKAASSGASSALLGGLLQAAGQVAQATGSGQGYESGLLMQGVGAVLTGDNAAAQRVVESSSAGYSQGAGESAVDNRPVLHCVKFTVVPGARPEVRNICDFDINVAWCPHNAADGSCGGILQLSRNSAQTAMNSIGGKIFFAACRWPSHVSRPNGDSNWRGGDDGSYSCTVIK